MARPDPRKLKDEAQDAVTKGKWKKALECYAALEKLEPKDGTWPQRAGEMNRRLGKKEDAVAALSRAAETFSATGFLLKAIAVCKIVLEVDQGHTATQAKLAALHAQRTVGPGAATGIASFQATVRPASASAASAATVPPAPPAPPAPVPVPATRAAAPAPAAAPSPPPPPPPPPAARAAVAPPVPTPPLPPAATPPRPPLPPASRAAPASPSPSPPPPPPRTPPPAPPILAMEEDVDDDLETLAAEAAAALDEPSAPPAPAPAPAPPAPVPPAPHTAAFTSSGPPARTRTLPPQATLDQVSLGRVVPGARRSQEISAVGDAGAYEIPLDDNLDALFSAMTGGASADSGEPVIELDADATASKEISLLSLDESADAEAARAVFPRTPLFSALDERRLCSLIERVRLLQLEPGHAVFRQGDPGDALYVVASGEVVVQVGPDDAPTELARLGEGAFFGEIALCARQPRTATVLATQPTDLLAIDRDVLFDLIEDEPAVLKVILRFLRDRLLGLLLDTSPLFSPFTGAERSSLAARFRFIEADEGAQLLEQGKRAPGLFLLLAGGARVLHDGKPINDLGSGDMFGEMSLLSHGPAIATIIATAKCYLLELPRADFTELIMTHPQVLEHMSQVAEERQRQLESVKSGATRYGEGRVRIV